MIRTLLRIGVALFLVSALYIALLASEWLPRPGKAEAEALATLQAPRAPVAGPNASAVLWFLYHDLEGRDPENLMQDDVRRLTELAAAGKEAEFSALGGADPDAERLTVDAFCPPSPASCLDHVRSLADHGDSVLEPRAVVLRRLDALQDATHLSYPFRPEDPLQFAPFAGTMHVMRMAAAQQFVEGDQRGGLSLACRDLATWRRLAPTTDILIDGLVAMAWVDAHAGLVSEMLMEWPTAEPLPSPCDAALAAQTAAERDQCSAWQGEFRYLQARLRRPNAELRKEYPDDWPWMPSFVGDLLMNGRASAARTAVDYARGCATYPEAPDAQPDSLDWLFDPVGTMAYETEGLFPNQAYRERFADHLDLVDAVRLQAWLRDKPDVAAAMASLPPELAPLPDMLDVDPVARTVTLHLRQPGKDRPDTRTFALPPPMLPATAVAK